MLIRAGNLARPAHFWTLGVKPDPTVPHTWRFGHRLVFPRGGDLLYYIYRFGLELWTYQVGTHFEALDKEVLEALPESSQIYHFNFCCRTVQDCVCLLAKAERILSLANFTSKRMVLLRFRYLNFTKFLSELPTFNECIE